MKKILSLLALAMLCVTGANAEKVIYSWPSDASQANSITLAEGVTVAITGNTSKNIQSANKITIDGTEYTSMKVSNGAQNTLTLPKEAVGITFYSYVNKDAATDRAPYWKEVAGVEYTEETSGGTMTSYKDGANPDIRSFSFEATKEITFTNTGEQLCYVMEVEYAEAEVTTKTIALVPGPWAVDGATFAAYAWNDAGNAWFPFMEVSGVYATQIPDAFTGIILTRINPEGTDTDPWKNVWNQTDDIDFTAIADGTIFTITGWGEGEGAKSTYNTGTTIDIAKAQLQAAINEVSAYGLDGLAEAIAAAQAAVDAEDATIESIQAAAATFEAAVKAYVKELLSTAIPMVESLNAEDLAASIADAKAALGNDDATAKELATALFGLLTNARPYIITIMGQTVEVCALLGIDTTAAQALLDKGDEASTLELANALLGLTETAVPAAKEVLNTLKSYMTTFSSAAAVALKDDFETLENDINSGNIAAVKADIVTLMTKAAPYLKADIEKLEGYAAVINNEAITADVAAMKAAVEDGKFAELLAAVKKFEADLLSAAPDFVSTIKSAAAAYKGAGKTNGIEDLEAAISAAETALSAEDKTVVTVGLAIRNLVLAFKAYTEGYTTYTVAGTINLTATENAWDIVADNNMTLDTESGLYTWTAENITVSADSQPEFKVVITDINGNQTWIPASDDSGDHNWVITPDYLAGEGTYNITITFNAATKEIAVIGRNVITITINSMAIVGDFLGLEATEEDTYPNWNPANGWEMTKDAENTAIWTLTKEFTAEAKNYEYKATANGNWTDYVLPAGDNANYNFDTADLGAGKYILTFTVNTETNSINLNAVKVEEPVYADNILYSWESPEGTVYEYGGVITGCNDEDRINYTQSVYHTICLRGKADFSTQYYIITLNEGIVLNAGDTISITAFRNKDVKEKKSGAKIQFADNNSITTGDGTEFVNLNSAVEGEPEYGTEPNTINVIVPDGIKDCATIQITRSQTGTNLFISKLQIAKFDPTTTGISTVTVNQNNGAIFNLNGQRVQNAQRGLYIVNGRKVVLK